MNFPEFSGDTLFKKLGFKENGLGDKQGLIVKFGKMIWFLSGDN